jgi:hypothetical protein
MENTGFSRLRFAILAMALVAIVSFFPIVSVRADGNLLRGFDVPATVPSGHSFAPAIYWPIGVAFDGKNLWYSQPCDCTSGIFQASTSGILLKTLTEVKEAGALAWDGSDLWVGSFPNKGVTCTTGSTGCAFITEVDVVSGKPIKTIDLSGIFAQDQECSFIDGLSYDSSTGTFWVSPDIGCANSFTTNSCSIGFVYNVDASGNLLKRIQEPVGIAGVAKVGTNLYMVTCPPPTGGTRPIIKTTLDGTVVSSFSSVSISGHHEVPESLAFDPVTFAPACALWVVQDYGIPFDASLAAYQIACP